MKNFIKRLKELKPEQKRKLADELGCIATAILGVAMTATTAISCISEGAILGVVILVLNLLKIAPTNNILIAYVNAYGFLLGPCMIVLGIGGFFETRNTSVRKFRKKAR